MQCALLASIFDTCRALRPLFHNRSSHLFFQQLCQMRSSIVSISSFQSSPRSTWPRCSFRQRHGHLSSSGFGLLKSSRKTKSGRPLNVFWVEHCALFWFLRGRTCSNVPNGWMTHATSMQVGMCVVTCTGAPHISHCCWHVARL